MYAKNVIIDEGAILLKPILSSEFNVRMSNIDDMVDCFTCDCEVSPFVNSDYYAYIRKVNLFLPGPFDDDITYVPRYRVYTHLITNGEFTLFDTSVGYTNFEVLFLQKSRNYKIGFKTESHSEFIDRCTLKFQTDHLYIITLHIINTVEKEGRYRPNDFSLIPLKKLIMDLCIKLEEAKIFNYVIEPSLDDLYFILSVYDEIDQDDSRTY